MRKRFLIAGLVLVVVAAALVGIIHRPGTARANGTIYSTACVSGTSYCLELSGDSRTSGTAINLAKLPPPPVPESFGWHTAPLGAATLTTFHGNQGLCDRYCGYTIYNIEKSIPTGHDGCIYASSSANSPGDLVWNQCNREGNNVVWVLSGTYFFSNVAADIAFGSAFVMTVNQNSDGTCDYSTVFQAAPGQHCNIQF